MLRSNQHSSHIIMIQLSGAGKRFGHKDLFMNVDWLITPEDRIGLVGANGTGKTTILKILGGYEPLDYGTRQAAKGATCGYLPQDGLSMTGRTVFAECLSVFDNLKQMEVEMESLTRRMSELGELGEHASIEFTDVADRYHRIEHEFRMKDGYSVESQVGSVLTGVESGCCEGACWHDGPWQERNVTLPAEDDARHRRSRRSPVVGSAVAREEERAEHQQPEQAALPHRRRGAAQAPARTASATVKMPHSSMR